MKFPEATDEARSKDSPHARLRPTLIAALAMVFVLLSLHRGFIAGTGDYWQRLSGDPATAQIGWLYYARDAWRWPVFFADNFHAPEGANIYLTDSLPLLALPAKLVYKATGWLPTYTGAWVALCFFLQVVFASRLLTAIGVRAWLPHLAGVVLLSYMPAFFLRLGHMTLMAHFFLLAELESYVRARHGSLSRTHWFWVCALPVIAILVHPYMAATTLLLALAIIGDRWHAGALSMREVLARVGAIAGASAAVVVCSGFIFADTHPQFAYGVYGFNLLSPLVPFADTWLGAHLGTSTPTIPRIAQWEGGAYLGMGLLFLALCCLPFWRGAAAAVRRHVVLVTAIALAALFAISNRIGFGTHELLHIPLPHWLLGIASGFRASGRFIWPAMYTAALALIWIVAHRYRPPLAAGLLAVAALLQWIDVRPMQAARYAVTAAGSAPTIDEVRWRDLIAAHERIFQFPSFECGGIYDDYIEHTSVFRELGIDLIAARLDRPTNSAYLARFTKDCTREREQAGREMDRPGTLYLYRSSDDIGAYMAAHGQDTSRCASLDDVVVCSASFDMAALRAASAH